MLSNDANYEKYDPQVVTSGVARQAFPAVTQAILKKPRKIIVQASGKNPGLIYVGTSTVKSDLTTGGYELSAGQMVVLPGHMVADWYHIADTAGQKLLITYVTGEY